MTADDFFLLFIAFGGFLIVAIVLWSFARIVDRKPDKKDGPHIRPDIGSPTASNGHGREEAARSGRTNDALRRFADCAAMARRRTEHLDGIVDLKA